MSIYLKFDRFFTVYDTSRAVFTGVSSAIRSTLKLEKTGTTMSSTKK